MTNLAAHIKQQLETYIPKVTDDEIMQKCISLWSMVCDETNANTLSEPLPDYNQSKEMELKNAWEDLHIWIGIKKGMDDIANGRCLTGEQMQDWRLKWREAHQ